MTHLIRRLRDGGLWRVARYSAVSIAGIVVTQILLVALHGAGGFDATTANIVAVLVASVPVYIVNRSWVWQLTGPSSIRREIVPFWAFTIVGLVLSTVAVTLVARVSDSALTVTAANVGAFGLLWVAKFAVLDTMVFAPEPVPEPCTEDLAGILW